MVFRVIIYMLEVALVNSWVLYKCAKEQQETKALEFIYFRRSVAKCLIKGLGLIRKIPTTPLKANRRLPPSENQEFLGLCHLGKGTKRKCVQCKNRQTRYICAECGVPLCGIPCYDIHSYSMKKKMVKND